MKGFWKGFGKVREAQILDFRTFFDVFSMSFFKRDSEGEKLGHISLPPFDVGSAVTPLLGRGKERGAITADQIFAKNVEMGQL